MVSRESSPLGSRGGSAKRQARLLRSGLLLCFMGISVVMLLQLTSPKSFLGIWMLRGSASPQPLRRSFRSAFDAVNLARRSPSGTLDFKLCNGYANQLLSLFYGAVLALESNRQMVIPKALLDGTQASGENNLGTDSELVDVGRLWDRKQLLQALRSNGIKLLETEPIYQASSTYLVPNSEDLLSSVMSRPHLQHIRVNCPLLRLNGPTAAKYPQLFYDLVAVSPNKDILEALAVERARIPDVNKGFNALHLRIEDDWVRHCNEWQGQDCMGDYKHLGTYLRDAFHLDTSKPLLVMTDTTSIDPRNYLSTQFNLRKAGYKLVLPGEATSKLQREVRAILYYFLSLEADTFVGNHVSTFSAMLIIQRRELEKPAIHYNQGFIPLTTFLPFVVTPWVFTVNGHSTEMYIEMVKRSVLSLAMTGGTLKPFCLYHGSVADSLYTWLKDQGIHMTLHEPEWIDQLWEDTVKMEKQNSQHSHLYSDKVSLLSTFARIDIPLIEILEQYTYVLYTDNDIYFRGPIKLEELGELPKSASMAYEMDNRFPYNAGVMVMNLPHLRATYYDFLDFILTRKGDMWFDGFGPGDQGAYNAFYERSVNLLSEKFNGKTYKPYDKATTIVHFHGPKPQHYVEQLSTQTCSFHTLPSLCETGLAGFCEYAIKDGYFSDAPALQASAERDCKAKFNADAEGASTV